MKPVHASSFLNDVSDEIEKLQTSQMKSKNFQNDVSEQITVSDEFITAETEFYSPRPKNATPLTNLRSLDVLLSH